MFFTQNYTQIWCDQCNTRTTLEPGRAFKELECNCKVPNEIVKEEKHGDQIKPRATRQTLRKGKEQ